MTEQNRITTDQLRRNVELGFGFPDRMTRVASASLNNLVSRVDHYEKRLERIALGHEGRKKKGLHGNEGGGYGLPKQPKPDWQLAKEALEDAP